VYVTAKVAVIVPGPLTVAVVELELGFAKVMEPVLLDHCANGVLVVGVALIDSEPESDHMLVPVGLVVPLPGGDTAKEIGY
jgi:hypothetical protein